MRIEPKKKVPKALFSWPALVILLGITVLLILGVVNLIPKLAQTAENKRVAQERLAELEAQEEKLSSEIEILQTDAGVERTIRENFGLAKEGEGVVVIVDEPVSVGSDEGEKRTGGFFEFLRDIFSDRD